MFCAKCGLKIPDSIKFCPRCGNRILENGMADEDLHNTEVMGERHLSVPEQEKTTPKKKKASGKKKAILGLLCTVCCIAAVMVIIRNESEIDGLFADKEPEQTENLQKQATETPEDDESTYLRAKDYLNQKDYASAINELETIPHYKDVKELLQSARYEYGISLYDKSQYAQAIEQLNQTTGYKETEKYLDKCRMERKYEKFGYDSFSTLGDDSIATMTNKEIREYMEECMSPMYSSWYQQDEYNESIIIDKYFIDGKEYGISSWGGEGNYTEFDIYYMDDTENKIHINLAPDFAYMDVSEEPTMVLSIGDMFYLNYTSSQEKEYAELNEAWQKENEENVKLAECYLPGNAISASLDTYVHYARVGYDNNQQTNVVIVACTVSNNSGSNLQFVAGNYFALNYNGVITNARSSQYDYTTLAPGGSFFTEISFNCPTATRGGDTLDMTMFVENAQIHLGPAPQNDEEINRFPGIYMGSSYSFDSLYIVTDAGDGTYNIVWVSDALGSVYQYENVTLDNENRFSIGNGDFLWNPEGCVFYRYDYDEEEYDRNDLISKQNSYEP